MASNKKNKEVINPIFRSRRHEGRILAFQVLYSFDINQIDVQQLFEDTTKMEELENFSWKNDDLVENSEQLPLETVDYARFLIEGTFSKKVTASSTVMSRTSYIDLPLYRHSKVSRL